MLRRSVCLGAVLFLFAATLPASGQSVLRESVVNAQGEPIANAQVRDAEGRALTISAADGSFTVSAGTRQVEISAPRYVTATLDLATVRQRTIILERPLETVVVTASRSPLASEDSPVSERVLNSEELRQSASITLDGRLRQVPGFALFRRSSSLVANPTTEGVSLRGLGSTAASRSLVLFDDIPLNDPFGGWIHWDEIPPLAIRSVEVARGGGSDLYGSSAIGGVINILPVRPRSDSLEITSRYGGLETTDNALLATIKRGPWTALGASGIVATDGYTLVAPSLRGPVDQPSNVHAQNGLVEFARRIHSTGRVFLRGNVLNEARHNGTPLTTNGIRLWRYATGVDLGGLDLRFYGSSEHYRQTFSSIAPGRVSEKLTRYGYDPAGQLGASARWSRAFAGGFLAMAGADTHDVRASDDETLISAGGLLSTTARQRQTGVYGEVLATPEQWTFSASGRVDHFSNFDAHQFTALGAGKPLASFSETVFDPRLGVVRRIARNFFVSASGFRAYRAPTENELYRTSQVGQQITLPNDNLRSERATGWETGLQAELPRLGSAIRASYFWTQVNRPITALTLSTTSTMTTLERENLGRIESRGLSLDYAIEPAGWISLQGGYQYAVATVTKYQPEPELVGKWIPQVARNMATAQLRLSRPGLGLLSLQASASGRQYEDDLNLRLLHSYFRLDAYASHDFGRHLRLFASGQNLFDRSIEVGKTPVLTLGTPRTAAIGMDLRWGG